ncbi:MAG TPA: carboxypeptidase-like regulatory domain-containing protein, partial [Thermoanaerobaculia bacterium]
MPTLLHRLARPAVILAALLALLLPHLAAAGQVKGHVLGPDGQPLAGVPLVLANDVTGAEHSATSAADGSYSFFNVPANPYHLRAE